MTALISLLACITVVGLLGHRPLQWAADRRIDPTVLLTGWILSCVGLVVAALATVALLVVPPHEHRSPGLFRLAGDCLAAMSTGSVPGGREALAALGVAGSTVVLWRLASAIRARIRAGRQRAPHLEQLRLLAGRAAPHEPLWIRDDRPLAMSVGGRPGVIIMSDTLRRHLTSAAVAATLEHERAHLRGRHHLMVAIAQTLATALPVCPLLRRAPSAVEDLVELAADARAAHHCGPAAVREALCRLTGQPAAALGLAMADRLVDVRLERLSAGTVGSRPATRVAGCLAVAIGALLLPVAAGLSAYDVIGCLVV
jgi:Peptidase family M48